jgi:hypothetical protein
MFSVEKCVVSTKYCIICSKCSVSRIFKVSALAGFANAIQIVKQHFSNGKKETTISSLSFSTMLRPSWSQFLLI